MAAACVSVAFSIALLEQCCDDTASALTVAQSASSGSAIDSSLQDVCSNSVGSQLLDDVGIAHANKRRPPEYLRPSCATGPTPGPRQIPGGATVTAGKRGQSELEHERFDARFCRPPVALTRPPLPSGLMQWLPTQPEVEALRPCDVGRRGGPRPTSRHVRRRGDLGQGRRSGLRTQETVDRGCFGIVAEVGMHGRPAFREPAGVGMRKAPFAAERGLGKRKVRRWTGRRRLGPDIKKGEE